ncbi:MAG: hypothetical protein ACRDHM_03420 [Actinomycetota bacterium]
MNKLLIGAVVALALVATPAVAQTEPVPTPPCPVSSEYPTLGLGGKHEDVDSPLLPDTLQALGEPFTSQTYVNYKYRLDISGSETKPFATKANVAIDLNWDNDGDFDLYVYDSTDSLIGSSTDFVADRVENVVLVGTPQCTDFRVEIRNFLAPPAVTMTLDSTVSSLKP